MPEMDNSNFPFAGITCYLSAVQNQLIILFFKIPCDGLKGQAL